MLGLETSKKQKGQMIIEITYSWEFTETEIAAYRERVRPDWDEEQMLQSLRLCLQLYGTVGTLQLMAKQ